jgi:hypothetical protein
MRSGPSSARKKSTPPPRRWSRGTSGTGVAVNPQHRLVVSVVVGKRTEEPTRLPVEDFDERTMCRSRFPWAPLL